MLRVARVLAFVGFAAPGLPALGIPSYGTLVDQQCSARGWQPPRPFDPNQTGSSDPSLVNCSLCHLNAASPNGQLNTRGLQFQRSGRTDVSLFCAALNRAPLFADIAPQQASAGRLFELMVRASDPDGDALALSISNAPAGAAFTDNRDGTGLFRWTPGVAQTGSVVVRFHATDAGAPMASSFLDVAIAVGAIANGAPLLAPVGDQQIDAGATLTLAFDASDPDGDALAFTLSPLPSGAELVGNAFAWTPSAAQVGSYPVLLTVTDDGSPMESDSEALVITVGAVNRPPELQPIGDRSAQLGDVVRIALVSSDADGDAVALTCSGLPADASFSDLGDRTGEIVWTPVAAGQSSVTCQATDAGTPAGVAEETFFLTARAVTPPPGAGAPTLADARWEVGSAGGTLVVHGSAPLPAPRPCSRDDDAPGGCEAQRGGTRIELYAVLADGSALLLGRGRSGRDGQFRLRLATFIAPCEVAAAANGALGAALPVQDAPASCDRELLLRVRRAELSCDGSRLSVEGRRAPPGGLVLGDDASSGERVFAVPTRGTAFRARLGGLASAPSALRIRAQSGGFEWELPVPVPVRRHCERD